MTDGSQKHVRIATMVVNVSAVMPGTIDDWPANIQDGVYAALERLCMRKRTDFVILKSFSETDMDSGPYVYVVAGALETVQ